VGVKEERASLVGRDIGMSSGGGAIEDVAQRAIQSLATGPACAALTQVQANSVQHLVTTDLILLAIKLAWAFASRVHRVRERLDHSTYAVQRLANRFGVARREAIVDGGD